MKRGLGYLLAAAGGALIGALAVKLSLEKRYRDELKNIEQDLWSKYKTKLSEKTELATQEAVEALDIVKTELEELRQKERDQEKLRKLGVVNALEMTSKEREVQLVKAFVIRPDEYGTEPDFARFRYVFYPELDKYYNSDCETPVDKYEIDDMLGGVHPEDHFGEFEDETVYIRNEDLKVDLAIYLGGDSPGEDEE